MPMLLLPRFFASPFGSPLHARWFRHAAAMPPPRH